MESLGWLGAVSLMSIPYCQYCYQPMILTLLTAHIARPRSTCCLIILGNWGRGRRPPFSQSPLDSLHDLVLKIVLSCSGSNRFRLPYKCQWPIHGKHGAAISLGALGLGMCSPWSYQKKEMLHVPNGQCWRLLGILSIFRFMWFHQREGQGLSIG